MNYKWNAALPDGTHAKYSLGMVSKKGVEFAKLLLTSQAVLNVLQGMPAQQAHKTCSGASVVALL